MRLPVFLALLIRAANGFGLGAYLLTYAKIITDFGKEALPEVGELSLGKAFILWIFVCVLGLRMRSGYFTQRYGFRAGMMVGFFARCLYFLCLVGMCFVASGATFLTLLLVGGLVFAICYTLLEGNFEVYLRQLVQQGQTPPAIFGWTLAIQSAFTILGSLVAVICFGAGTSLKDLQAQELIWLPFAIAAGLCLAVSLLSALLPSTPQSAQPSAELRRQAAEAFRNCLPFRRLTWLATFAAILFQGMSVLVPLIILNSRSTVFAGTESTILARWLILGLATFGPQAFGNVWQAFVRPHRVQLTPPELLGRVVRATVIMALASAAFCVAVIGFGAQPSWYGVAILFVALICQRYYFGIFDSSQREAATAILTENQLSQVNDVMMSILEWWKAIGGLAVTLASVIVGYVVARENESIADSWLLISVAVLAVAASFLSRNPNPPEARQQP